MTFHQIKNVPLAHACLQYLKVPFLEGKIYQKFKMIMNTFRWQGWLTKFRYQKNPHNLRVKDPRSWALIQKSLDSFERDNSIELEVVRSSSRQNCVTRPTPYQNTSLTTVSFD